VSILLLVSYFQIDEIASLANTIENDLDKNMSYHLKTISRDLKELQSKILKFIDNYDNILNFKKHSTSKQIPMEKLLRFYKDLNSNNDLAEIFEKTFFTTEINRYIEIYPTLVSELATKHNKKIRFNVSGGELQIPDKQWEELFYTFVHFIRNSIDHGIESANERTQKGKPEYGLIEFQFKVSQSKLQIILKDDGAGVDWKKLQRKDPTILNEEDALKRISSGGISSKNSVSELSGRGVGISAIFEVCTKWNGTAELKSIKDIGMTLEIQIPLTKEQKQTRRAA